MKLVEMAINFSVSNKLSHDSLQEQIFVLKIFLETIVEYRRPRRFYGAGIPPEKPEKGSGGSPLGSPKAGVTPRGGYPDSGSIWQP